MKSEEEKKKILLNRYTSEMEIIKLRILRVHKTMLYGEKDFLFVIMSAKTGGRVAINWFSQCED